jgi:hypothetical protein
MKYTDEDFTKMWTASVNKPYGKPHAPRAVYVHDGRVFHFSAPSEVCAVSIFYKTDKELEKRLPDFIYDSHKATADLVLTAAINCTPLDGYKETISGMRKLGLSEKVAMRMLSDHGIHPPKVSINLWSLHKFTSIEAWIKMNLVKRSEIK